MSAAVEGGTVVALDTADLVSGPVSFLIPASLLQKHGMARVEAETAFLTPTTMVVLRARVSSSSDMNVVIRGRVEIPVACSN